MARKQETSGSRGSKAKDDRLARFVGRNTELEKLHRVLAIFCETPAEQNWLRVVPISGFGGIGKTTLIDQALETHQAELSGTLALRVNRATVQDPFNFISYVDSQLAPATLPSNHGKSRHDYFPQTRHLVRLMKRLERAVDEDLQRSGLSDASRLFAKSLFKARPLIGKMGPKGKAMSAVLAALEFTQTDESLAEIIDRISSLHALQQKRRIFRKLRKESMADLKDDPYESIAQTWVGDLSAILARYRFKDRFKYTHGSIDKLNRLLLVVDDYETTGDILAPFLLGGAIRALRDAQFPTLVIMIGRDNLADSKDENVAWQQHNGDLLSAQVELHSFSSEESILLLQNAGYSKTRSSEIHRQTRGVPELLRFFADTVADYGSDSALYYQEFYERTTRWMNSRQKSWLMALMYLDTINLSTVEAMFPGDDAEEIVDWFRAEGSVRDKRSSAYVVTPIVREMLLGFDLNRRGKPKVTESKILAEKAMKHA